MKPEVTLKYLQYLRNKKDGEEGFTLIELLVVVIIIGVLAAVALPNLLGQVGKARETEIKNAAGSVNRAQQAYHFEKQTFGVTVSLLGVILPSEYVSNATALVSGVTDSFATVNPENSNAVNDGTRSYAGRINYAAGNYSQIICQSADIATGIAALASATDCPAPLSEIR
jgi:type IV pilus assembly protein PilA